MVTLKDSLRSLVVVMSKNLLSFIIINWNGGNKLIAALKSIHDILSGHINYDIIVADNGSTDGSITHAKNEFPHIKIVQYDKNYFFAKPVNKCVELSNSEFIFLLNNDATIKRFPLHLALQEFQKESSLGAIAPQLRYETGIIQCSVRRFPTLKRLFISGMGLESLFPASSWKLPSFCHEVKSYVDQPMMAALMIKKECWEDVGPLDDKNFPLYFNDVDWCYRAHKKGWKILFHPSFTICHHEAMSGRRLGYRQYLYSAKGLYLFFRKHHIGNPFNLKWPLIVLLSAGLLMRGIAISTMRRITGRV